MREHGAKTTPVFLPADGEASWSLVPSSVSLLSGGTDQPENTYSSIICWVDSFSHPMIITALYQYLTQKSMGVSKRGWVFKPGQAPSGA